MKDTLGIKLIFLLILLSVIILRIPNLETIPYWHWDEGVNMNISHNLSEGRLLWFSLRYVFVPHPPLFFVVTGILLRILGNELIVLRGLSVFYSIITTIFIYLIGKELFNKKTGLLASFLFAIYPCAIYWNRMGFANNQLMLLSVLTLYSFLQYLKHKRSFWFCLTSLSISLCMITEFTGILYLISILLLFWLYERKQVLKAIIFSASLFVIFLLTMFVLFREEFTHDVIFQFQRFNLIPLLSILLLFSLPLYHFRTKIIDFYGNIPYEFFTLFKIPPERAIKGNFLLFLCLSNLLLALTLLKPLSDQGLLEGIDYFWLGILGLFLINRKVERNSVLLFSIPFLLFILILGRTDHMLIPLHPYFALGLVILLQRIYKFLISLSDSAVIPVLAFLLLSYPFAFVIYYDVSSFVFGKNLKPERVDERYAVAEFINKNTLPKDIVLADSHFTRLIECRTSVLLQAIAIEGKPIAYMAPDYKAERFIFNCSYRNTRFIVVDKKDKEWLKKNSKEISDEIKKWSVLEIGDYLIYKNPKL